MGREERKGEKSKVGERKGKKGVHKRMATESKSIKREREKKKGVRERRVRKKKMWI